MNLKKMERYLLVNLLGPGPRLMKKIIYRAAVSQRLRNTGKAVGRCHHGMARPQVANGGTASDMQGSCEYIE